MPSGQYVRTEELRKKIGLRPPSFAGKHHSPSARARIGAAARSRNGPLGSNWQGDNVKYSGLHKWVRKKFGKPQVCSMADGTCSKTFEWSNISGKYKRDRTDWQRLCVSHHRRYDNSIKNLYAQQN